jgi:hypothetical protein
LNENFIAIPPTPVRFLLPYRTLHSTVAKDLTFELRPHPNVSCLPAGYSRLSFGGNMKNPCDAACESNPFMARQEWLWFAAMPWIMQVKVTRVKGQTPGESSQ